MTATRATLTGAPVWIDLMTTDTDRAAEFYGALFGWTAESAGPEYGGYINFSKDGAKVAGCMADQAEGAMGSFWSIYLQTDDAERTVAAAEANGGAVYLAAMDVLALGRMAMVGDPAGSAIGIWQPGEHKGFEAPLAVPGSPGWFELHTRDFARTVRFYEDVFGWDTHVQGDTDEFRYMTLGEGEARAAGIMDASLWSDDAPTGWSIYFQVADVDAALAQITSLGGSITIPAEDTPYGRLAAAVDPTGAPFKLVG